jgi:hypothetical protein
MLSTESQCLPLVWVLAGVVGCVPAPSATGHPSFNGVQPPCCSESAWGASAAAKSDPGRPGGAAEPAREGAEEWFAVELPRVDLLLVIDDSCSMDTHQQELSDSLPALLEWLDGGSVDYHIGVITTDMESPSRSGRLLPAGERLFIDPHTEHAGAALATLARPGTTGSATERGLEAIHGALDLAGTANQGFFRSNTPLAILVVSDEDDESRDIDSHVQALASYDASLAVSGVVNLPGCCPYASQGTAGWGYLALADQFGGSVFDITQPLAGTAEAVLSEPLAPVPMELTHPAVPHTVQVFDDEQLPLPEGSWEFQSATNAILILSPMDRGVMVRYQFDPTQGVVP